MSRAVVVVTTLIGVGLLVLQGMSMAPTLVSSTRGGDAELRRQLASANRELGSLRDQLTTERRRLAALQQSGGEVASQQQAQQQAQQQPAQKHQLATPPQAAQRWDETPDHRRLYELLTRVANPRREVMTGLVNDVMMCTNHRTCWWNGGNILETFLQALKRIGLTNYAMVTLDDATEQFCQRFGGVPSLRMALPVPTAQQGSRGANMISTLKYGLLRQMLLMEFSVLVVDLDIIFLKDPFAHLYRDADIEGSTDGFTAAWAGGSISSVHEPRMGWGAGGLYVQFFTMNVGCAFIQPTPRAIDLMERVARRLSQAAAWDQQVFNQEAMLLSHGAYNGSKVSLRVLHFDQWVNSKVYFFSSRSKFIPGHAVSEAETPVMVHMNYHPDKHKRMLCVWERYTKGKLNACDQFPGGSEKGT